MSTNDIITNDNIEKYIEELSKEYKKINNNKNISRMIFVGGAAVLLNYNFRKKTDDIDASIYSSKEMLDAIKIIAEKNKLPKDWINTDFENSPSYSEKLKDVSKFYKMYNNKLEIRLIEGEYLIAMKLTAGRKTKHDFSDIAGILMEHKNRGKEIKIKDIDKAVKYLYGNWNKISKETKSLLNKMLKDGNYEKIYNENKMIEETTKNNILKFGNTDNFLERIKGNNNSDIINTLIDNKINSVSKT